MFTVLSNTRNSNLYWLAALAAMTVVLLTFAFVPSISVPGTASAPAPVASEARSDYYQRHPEMKLGPAYVTDLNADFFQRRSVLLLAAPVAIDTAADFYLRHPEWTIAPALLNAEGSDYFQRHPGLIQPAGSSDLSDYFLRH